MLAVFSFAFVCFAINVFADEPDFPHDYKTIGKPLGTGTCDKGATKTSGYLLQDNSYLEVAETKELTLYLHQKANGAEFLYIKKENSEKIEPIPSEEYDKEMEWTAPNYSMFSLGKPGKHDCTIEPAN